MIQRALGDFRTFASQVAHCCPEINEEEFFAMIAENYLTGIKYEVSKIFGSTKTKRMLDPFNG